MRAQLQVNIEIKILIEQLSRLETWLDSVDRTSNSILNETR